MRTLVLLLLLANVAFFAWDRYGAELFSGEAGLVSQQLNPGAIQLLTPEQVAARGTAKREGPKPSACLEWGTFTGAEIARAEAALESLALGGKLSQRRVEETAGYWVFMPPQGSRQGANQKIFELKKLGVEDYFILLDDPKFRYAISLGVFKTEEAAKSYLESLRGRGVRTAQVAARDVPMQKTFFLIRDVPEPLAAKINELRQGFAGTEIRECPLEEKRG